MLANACSGGERALGAAFDTGRPTSFPAAARASRVPGGMPRAALFITCFNDTLFPAVGRSTVALLERLGVDVDFPEEQTCCGQMHSNSGYQLEAVPLARRFVELGRYFGAPSRGSEAPHEL